jgi:two-component system, NarL family, invasion response regulator UvrY
VIGETCDAASAYQCYKDTRPDVVIMDISMPGRRVASMQSSISVSWMLTRASSCSQCTAELLTPYRPPKRHQKQPPDLLVRAVRDIAKGRLAICPETKCMASSPPCPK